MTSRNVHIRECRRCGLPYDWRRSPSSYLKMTYCSTLCERADLGFTVEALLRDVRFVPKTPGLNTLFAA